MRSWAAGYVRSGVVVLDVLLSVIVIRRSTTRLGTELVDRGQCPDDGVVLLGVVVSEGDQLQGVATDRIGQRTHWLDDEHCDRGQRHPSVPTSLRPGSPTNLL